MNELLSYPRAKATTARRRRKASGAPDTARFHHTVTKASEADLGSRWCHTRQCLRMNDSENRERLSVMNHRKEKASLP